MRRWLVGLCLLTTGCKANDADLLAKTCQRAVRKLTGGPGGELAGRLRGPFAEASLAARVHNRLRWDRHLEGIEVHVRATPQGVVTLRGTVPDETSQRRAIDLARNTVGVERVVDELRLSGTE